MKPSRIIPLLILLAGCGGGTRVMPAEPPPRNPGDRNDNDDARPGRTASADPLPAQDDKPVAFIDKEPVSWRAVVDFAMTTRGKELIDKYILWKLRKDRLEELDIKNTPDDLRKRAKLLLTAYRLKAGDEPYRKKLEELRMTEEAYVERFVANPEFDEHVRNEKAVVYTLLTDPSIEIDTVAFTDAQEAGAFIGSVGRTSFGQAAEALMKESNLKGRVAFWPRYRFTTGLSPEAIAGTPDLEDKLFRMKKGQTSDVEKTAGGILVVIHIVETHAAAPSPYPAVAERVLAELLRQPPTDEQIRIWMDRLFKSKRIRYEDRYTPGNQGR